MKLIKKIFIAIFIIFQVNCEQSSSTNKIYNDFNENIDVRTEFVNKLTEFDVEFSSDTSSEYIKNYYHFKSSNPISKNESGNYYYRWTLSITSYTDHKKAVKAFNKYIQEFNELEDLMENKGNNSSTIIVRNHIFKISASCLEGWHQQEWFEQLLSVLLGENIPDEMSIIQSNCGGSWELK